jgi:hypothetical protein
MKSIPWLPPLFHKISVSHIVFIYTKLSKKQKFSCFDNVFFKLNQELSYLINIEVHHKMNLWNDTAMSRTLQTDECAKLLNIFEGGFYMSEAKNTVPIYHKITLSITEANKLTGIGINSIEDRLREPNCPFVLYIGVKKMVKRKEFEEYISKTTVF